MATETMTSDRLDHGTNPYLAILLEHTPGGGQQVHAGLAHRGVGIPFCAEGSRLLEFALCAQDPRFALRLENGWRHRYAEAFLELNRGCRTCLAQMYAIGKDLGYALRTSAELN
jgi:hypothetical protein